MIYPSWLTGKFSLVPLVATATERGQEKSFCFKVKILISGQMLRNVKVIKYCGFSAQMLKNVEVL